MLLSRLAKYEYIIDHAGTFCQVMGAKNLICRNEKSDEHNVPSGTFGGVCTALGRDS